MGNPCLEDGILVLPKEITQAKPQEKTMLGYSFRPLNDPDACFVFIGETKLLETYVLPNLGLDLPLFHGSPSEGTFDEVAPRQVNKTLMQRYANVTAV